MGGETNLRTVTRKPVTATASTLQFRGCSLTMLFTILYGPPPMSEFTSYLRELPALPQGRWFICALGGGSDADGLSPQGSRERFGRQFHRLEVPRLENATGETLDGLSPLTPGSVLDDSFTD